MTTLTLTAESTTAALAWERRGVTRSQILREREREREREKSNNINEVSIYL